MGASPLSVLTAWPFVLALTTLIVNDAWFKSAWPGVITGKLSDVAGIAVVALLVLSRLPKRPLLVYALVAAGFTWWKSPWSQPFIDAVNTLVPGTTGRIVDYTDLFALLVVPFCARVARRPKRYALPGTALRRALLAPVAAATVLGLMATSLPQVRNDYRVQTLEPTGVLNRGRITREIEHVARENGLECTDCTDPTSRAMYDGKGVHMEYAFTDDRTIKFKVSAMSDGLFTSRNSKKLERLRRDLKYRLPQAQVGLEFVQSLDRQYPP